MTANVYMLSCLLVLGFVVVVAALSSSARAALIKGWLTLNGVATPDGTHPTGRRFSVLRMRVAGAVFTAAGLVSGYFFILGPIQEAKRNQGVLHQSLFGLVMPIVLLCGGIVQLVFDLRDEKTMWAGPDGKLRWNSRGRMAELGVPVMTGFMVLAWYLYVRLSGLHIF